MKLFQKTSTKIKYTCEIDGKKMHGKVRAFIPPISQLSNFAKIIFSKLELDELLYLSKMIKFSMIFPIDNNNEYVDYKEMVRCGLISKDIYASPLDNRDVKTLFFNATKGSMLQVNMSEEGYYSFRDMVLEEFEEFDSKLDDMFKKAYQEKVKDLSLYKKIRIHFARRKLAKLKEDIRKEVWQMLVSTANAHSNEIAKRDFPKRASELLDNFDYEKYKVLIKDVTNELNLQSSDVYQEIITFLNNEDIQNEKENVLGWIIDNTCSTETAFENVKRESDYINKEIFHKYCIHFYKIHRKEMNREEKRLFQLCYFRREAFQYRIPALDDFMRSFWKENMQLIFSGLILKSVNPGYKKDNKILEEKWEKFLSIYPYALNSQKLFNHLKDKNKIRDMIDKNYSGKDMQILHAFVDGHEIETILAEFGCSKNYCLELVERYKEDAKSQENALIITK